MSQTQVPRIEPSPHVLGHPKAHISMTSTGVRPASMRVRSSNDEDAPQAVENYTYFVALVVVEDGSIQVRSSPEMKSYTQRILGDAARNFQEVMSHCYPPRGMIMALLSRPVADLAGSFH
jgi:hypothetical protein